MKIIKIQALRGANIWSSYRKNLIQMRLDLQDMEQRPTNLIAGFRQRLEQALPSLVEHECSEGVRGGFFSRVEEGTWMGHVVEHIALELQTLAGMDTGYGRTRSTREYGVYNVIFSYVDEQAGRYAGEAAVKMAQALADGQPYNCQDDIAALREIYNSNALGPSTKSIVDEAARRGIPWARLGANSTIQLGYGARQMKFQATLTGRTSAMAVELAGNKSKTKRVLAGAGVPVPEGMLCEDPTDLDQAIAELGFPLVIKPLDANQGKGATINIVTVEDARSAFALALRYSEDVIVERYIPGSDFRLLVIDHKFVAAAKRVPAHVRGTGKATIYQLIEELNADQRRGEGHENVLTKVAIDGDTKAMLARQGYHLAAIPGQGETVFLKSTANLSTGGSAIDVTGEVHPENIALAEQVSRLIGLDICGIDVMAMDLCTPLRQNGGAVIEVNAAPGFRMHLAPSHGTAVNVAAPVVDMLYPQGSQSRIPIVAVTGTNGKTTTTRLVAHIAQTAGLATGFTTTDGTYINQVLQQTGDNTGPQSAKMILGSPSVEFAVLETARGGILRAGLGFDYCDAGIITNIKEDHLGLNDIETLDDLAQVKGVVVRNVRPEGYAILNGDDAKCREIARELDCKLAFFSLEKDAAGLQDEFGQSGMFAFCEDGFITIMDQSRTIRLCRIASVPVTYQGRAGFMVANVLAAALAGYTSGFDQFTIVKALKSFTPDFETAPGRMNLFEFSNFSVLVDFAHNPHGYGAIREYLDKVTARKKRGVISGVGDRRDTDIRDCGAISASMFDHVIIKSDRDLRGREESVINAILIEGLLSEDTEVSYEVISDECQAVRHAIAIAKQGDYIVILSDQIGEVAAVVNELYESEKALASVQSA
jgi:cyanophycin synthetase